MLHVIRSTFHIPRYANPWRATNLGVGSRSAPEAFVHVAVRHRNSWTSGVGSEAAEGAAAVGEAVAAGAAAVGAVASPGAVEGVVLWAEVLAVAVVELVVAVSALPKLLSASSTRLEARRVSVAERPETSDASALVQARSPVPAAAEISAQRRRPRHRGIAGRTGRSRWTRWRGSSPSHWNVRLCSMAQGEEEVEEEAVVAAAASGAGAAVVGG